MEKKKLGVIIVLPALAFLLIGGYWVVSRPNPSVQYERIVMMPTVTNGAFDFDLAHAKFNKIVHFIQTFPQDPRGEEMVLQFFRNSAASNRGGSLRGELLIFFAQLLPVASDDLFEEAVNHGWSPFSFHSEDPFYSEVKSSSEKLMTRIHPNLNQADKAAQFIAASQEIEWQKKIISLAKHSTVNRDEQKAIQLLEEIVDSTGETHLITGTYWPSDKLFSTANFKKAALVLIVADTNHARTTVIETQYIENYYFYSDSARSAERILVVPKQPIFTQQMRDNLTRAEISVVVSPENHPASLLTEKFSYVLLEYKAGGKLVGLKTLRRARESL